MMKKLFAMVLCIVCMLCMSVSASASAVTVSNEDKAEADELWTAFLEAVEAEKDSEGLQRLLEVLSDAAEFNSKFYAEYTGRDAQEYLDMTDMDKFLWYVTFIEPSRGVNAGDYQMYLATLDKWNRYTLVFSKEISEKCSEETFNAYAALMEWDYNYFRENGVIYNFITGKTNIAEKHGTDDAPTVEDGNKAAAEEREQLEQEVKGEMTPEEWDEAVKEFGGDAAPQEPPVEKDGLSVGDVVAFVLMVAVVGGGLYYFLFRKRE